MVVYLLSLYSCVITYLLRAPNFQRGLSNLSEEQNMSPFRLRCEVTISRFNMP